MAINLENKLLGGRASLIMTTFSNEKVKWKNIYIQGSNKGSDLENKDTSLAVIIYENKIGDEWIGLQSIKREEIYEQDFNVIFSTGLNKTYNFKNTGKNIKNEKAESLLRKINVNNLNPFRNIETDEEKELSKSCPGSPIYY